MHENIPYVHLCDGFHFLDAMFTEECIRDFRKNSSHLKFHQLKNKLIILTTWRIVLNPCLSTKEYASYMNLRPVIVVEKFRPATHISAKDSQMSKAISLFKDASMRTYVESFRASFCSQLLEYRVEGAGDFEIGTVNMPKLKEV